jgi:hypothetical protein
LTVKVLAVERVRLMETFTRLNLGPEPHIYDGYQISPALGNEWKMQWNTLLSDRRDEITSIRLLLDTYILPPKIMVMYLKYITLFLAAEGILCRREKAVKCLVDPGRAAWPPVTTIKAITTAPGI